MANRNITLTLPEELVRRVKVRAAQEDTSVSALVRDLLARYVGTGDYDAAWISELRFMREESRCGWARARLLARTSCTTAPSDPVGLQFVDTNVLLHAFDRGAGDRHDRAVELVEGLAVSGDGALSVQILQEFHVMERGSQLRTGHRGRRAPGPVPVRSAIEGDPRPPTRSRGQATTVGRARRPSSE